MHDTVLGIMGGTGMLKIAPKTASSALCCNGGSFFRLPALMRYIRQHSQGPLTASLSREAMEQMVCNLEVQETSVHVNNIKFESCFEQSNTDVKGNTGVTIKTGFDSYLPTDFQFQGLQNMP